jgi:hypothetical protein
MTFFCAYIDYSKAFDTIPGHLLLNGLEGLGIHGTMLRTLESIYGDVEVCVQTPEGLTDSFPCRMGVKQGCPLSPLLFGLYIDELQISLGDPRCFDAPFIWEKRWASACMLTIQTFTP